MRKKILTKQSQITLNFIGRKQDQITIKKHWLVNSYFIIDSPVHDVRLAAGNRESYICSYICPTSVKCSLFGSSFLTKPKTTEAWNLVHKLPINETWAYLKRFFVFEKSYQGLLAPKNSQFLRSFLVRTRPMCSRVGLSVHTTVAQSTLDVGCYKVIEYPKHDVYQTHKSYQLS